MKDSTAEQAEIDAWMREVRRRTEQYVSEGIPKIKASERAVDEIRREIRQSWA